MQCYRRDWPGLFFFFFSNISIFTPQPTVPAVPDKEPTPEATKPAAPVPVRSMSFNHKPVVVVPASPRTSVGRGGISVRISNHIIVARSR